MHGMVVIDGMAHRETGELGREGVKAGHQIVHHVNLRSNDGGSLDCSLAERPFSLVLPVFEPVFGRQYVHGLKVLASRPL